MRFVFLIYFLFLFFSVSFGQKSVEISSKIDTYVQPYLDMEAWSGVVTIAKGDQLIFQKAYGSADREWEIPNSIDTKFRIASISKLFTEVAVLLLTERGLLSLNDPLSKYFPDYTRGDEITIDHLFSHRSGIPHLNSFSNYNELIKHEYQLKEVIDLFKEKPLDFDPGTRYRYSNSGYVLLAYIIEKTSGYTYEEFLKKEIFDKIGLSDTGIDKNELILEKRAKGYMFDSGVSLINAEYVNMSIKVGGGSLYSTAPDLLLFLRMLLEGDILKSTLEQLPNFEESNGETYFTVTGRVQGFCHQITHRMEEDLTIMILGNHYSNIALTMADDLYRIFSSLPYDIPQDYLKKEVEVSPEVLQKYEGTYDFGFGPVGEVKLYGNSLTYLPPGGKKADRLIPLGNHRFFYPQYWVLIEFAKEKGELFDELRWIMGENVFPAVRNMD